MSATAARLDPHDVYTAYDADGRVIYVGQSFNALQRLAQHRYTSPWGRIWSRIELRSFPTRSDALLYEAALIRAHEPPHNLDRPVSRFGCKLCAPGNLNILLDSYARFAGPVTGLSLEEFESLVSHSQFIARNRHHYTKQKA